MKIGNNQNKQEANSKTQIYNLIILDKSGSMHSIAEGAIAGFNETVGTVKAAQEQYADTQEHFVSLMVFCDCEKKMVYDKVPVEKVSLLTAKDYRSCCSTPLYDAMGMSLTALRNFLKDKENAMASVTVITDGYENASREYSGDAVRKLVEELTEKEGWSFAYMGANQDVEAVSMNLSIRHSLSFDYDIEGTREAFRKDRNAKMRMYDTMHEEHRTSSECSAMERKMRWAAMNANPYFMEAGDVAGRVTPERITSLALDEVFVFGSNLAGVHGGGAARTANHKFGAEYGVGVGPTGQCYAIPTMQGGVETIRPYVSDFIQYARQHPEKRFLVTRIGCGIAGFRDEEIAPLFVAAEKMENVSLPKSFWDVLL